MEGRTIGSYRVLERIGEGAAGRVYRARDLALDRTVALKALRPGVCDDPLALERFRAEGCILAGLQHRNVAAVHCLLEDDGELFMVMELVEGRSLAELQRERGRLAVDEALDLVRQALEGIAHAHERGVVHRDLKPANLMVGSDGVVKVTDFGIAKAAGSARLTRPGHTVGTLAYMSPEQLRGHDVDARADLYALGVLLYDLLAGELPFDESNDYALMRAHVKNDVPSLRAHVPELPERVERAVRRALAKAPAQRFESAEEFLAALDPAAPEPVAPAAAGSGDDDDTAELERGVAPPWAWIAIPVALLILALCVDLVMGRSLPPSTRTETPSTEPALEGRPGWEIRR